MKKINLYDYQQEMLENITKALTGRSQVTFYDQNGKKMKVGNSDLAYRYRKDLRDGCCGEMVFGKV